MGLPRSAFGGLRDRLVRECEGAVDCATTTTGFAAHHKPDPVTTYGNATFALQPWGDTATRKGFWDALAVGAVNVVFAPRAIARRRLRTALDRFRQLVWFENSATFARRRTGDAGRERGHSRLQRTR